MTTATRAATEVSLRDLVEATRTALLSCTNELVKVAAGILDSEGRIFTAVQVRSRNCNHCSVCAEAIALGMALTAGSTRLTTCVALVRGKGNITVWSPCGSCRELLRDQNVGRVIVGEQHGQPLAVPVADLLPWP